MLSENEAIRYMRQIVYPGFGDKGQEKLKAAHVVVIGSGGLGCSAAVHLAYAGFGHITMVDEGSVELSNLNRQVLHWERDIGVSKPVSATEKLRCINSGIKITAVCESVTEYNALDIIKGADVVIDGLDNFETRLVVNFACVRQGIPFIHAGVNGLMGQVTTIIPGRTPCLSCIYPEPPPTESVTSVFGVTPALMAAIQVLEAIKLVSGVGDTLEGRMLYLDGESMDVSFADLAKDPNCFVCARSLPGGN